MNPREAGPQATADPRVGELAPVIVRVLIAIAVPVVFFALPALGDHWVYAHFYETRVYDHDWAMALRAMGTLYVWIPVALIVWLVQGERDAVVAKRRALLVLGSPVIAGLLCEVLKLMIRRERPDVAAGNWVFRSWSDHAFSSAGLSTPSSHTIVAFGAAAVLSRMYPRARWVFYALAFGCGVTRVLSHAHYFSDATFGAALGVWVGWGVWARWGLKSEDRKTEDRGPRTEAGSSAAGA